MSVGVFLLHVSVLTIVLFGVYGGEQMKKTITEHKGFVDENLRNIPLYQYFYATNWNFMLQIFFISLAVLDELSKLLSLPSKVQNLLSKVRAYIFNSLVFPCSTLVVFTFWSIWAVDRELIFPKVMDTFFPSWLNHVLHTFIAIPLVIEILLPKKDNFVQFKNAAPILLFYAGLYQTLYFSIYLRDGVWLYPIYKVLSIPQMVLFNIVQMLLILGFQYVGISLQNSKMKKTEVGKKKVK
ncbi:androgen-dependent TFPI-regulating protein-like isoform X2 [Diabrotica virgifera virgifera]|uniref:Androgen-dependent TFPI-regulating protein-like n=1 Tax=Diabrotica virgifera virgifera TaxID=50390 RepID=A0ABM5KKV5_DIAVI|nr:androgen-dependent TFPI-regulating protein-like isoform X2 [Diabrotica virgifera virgifera]